jgi:acetylornithine/succinyldiaminopimelate/putrescine aminotransferase
MSRLLPELGISTEVVEPLFGMQGYTGGSLVLFKAGSKDNTQHYFYSPEDLTVRHITQLNDTKAIAQVIQESDYASIAMEEVEPQQ